jgi:RNA-directed DNA polymerase
MPRLDDLKSTSTLSDLANLLQVKPSALSYILFKQPADEKYKTFQIPKRNGGIRTIKAPIDALKLAQQKLSILLQDCTDEIDIAKNRKNRVSHGFRRRCSIVSNAREHRNRRYVFNLDLEDFFPSINFGRVRGYFIRDNNFALNTDVATVIAQIACHENVLPQGSPCSPVISNLIAHVLDMHLVRLAYVAGCTYTRYADDLTFSTNKKIFPVEIAELSQPGGHTWMPGAGLRRLIAHSGFRINPTKTHMHYRASRQEVTGLVVNRRINVPHEYRNTVRAMVHTLLNTGAFSNSEKRPGTARELHGMLGFIDTIDQGEKKDKREPKTSKDLSSNERIYRRFLIYTNFFAADTPVVLCEGETDNVYLTHAIRSLAADYPALATIKSDGKIELKVRLYKYRDSSTARVLGLRDGGSSSLGKLIGAYKKETTKFGASGEKHPLIILFDNDQGAKSIRSAADEASGKKLNTAEPFAHVVKNLYLVSTPLLNGATESKIEDFFEAQLKATPINGKTFDEKNDIDTNLYYGKKVFAHSVVRPNANSINFDLFRPLLTNLVAAITAHTNAGSATTPP